MFFEAASVEKLSLIFTISNLSNSLFVIFPMYTFLGVLLIIIYKYLTKKLVYAEISMAYESILSVY